MALATFANETRRPGAPIKFIAHALGSVDGHTYTNSIDAFEHNYGRNFRVFEIDLLLTGDGEVCAFHNVESLQPEFGVDGRIAETNRDAFLSYRYYGKYRPLCLPELTRLMQTYPDAYFVLDIKSSQHTKQSDDSKVDPKTYREVYRKLSQEWQSTPECWDRIIPYIYSPTDRAFLRSVHEFPALIYSLQRTSADDDEVLAFVKTAPEVAAVALNRDRFTEHLARQLGKMSRQIYVYTVNDPSEVDTFVRRGADGFITDSISIS